MLQSFLKGWKVAYNVTSEKFIFNQITIALKVFLSIESEIKISQKEKHQYSILTHIYGI